MSLESRFRHIVAAFGHRVSTFGDGTIFRPPAPIDVRVCLGAVVARHLAADRIEPLLDFGVRSPRSGAAAVGVLWIGDNGGLVCIGGPRRSCLAVAALLPPKPPTVSDFLLRFMSKNGKSFGVEFLQGPPLWIRNQRPDLLNRRAMKRALWAWMTWAECRGAASWQFVRRHVADRWGRDDWPETLSHEDRRKLSWPLPRDVVRRACAYSVECPAMQTLTWAVDVEDGPDARASRVARMIADAEA